MPTDGRRSGIPDICGAEASAADQVAQTTARWENSAKDRYYEAIVQRNLFGEWEVMRVWGGLGSARGSHQCEPVVDARAGARLIEGIARHREQRGYVSVAPWAVT